MKNFFLFFKNKVYKNFDGAKVEIGPLKMGLQKILSFDYPHELSIFIPRVEIKEKVNCLFFSKTREIIYNSITIVDAPRAPLKEGSEGNSTEKIEM